MKRISAQRKFQKHQRMLKKSSLDPATLYLESLAPSGRRPVRSLLQGAIARLGFYVSLEEMPWYLLEYQHIVQIRSQMLEEEYSINSVNLTISGLKGVMNACFELNLISAEELLRIKTVKRALGRKLPKGRALSEVEIKHLIRVCQKDRTIIGRRDLALIALMIGTGLRRAEVTRLARSDYDAKSGDLVILQGKGRKDRQLHLPTSVRQRVAPWLQVCGISSGPLFVRIRDLQLTESEMNGYDVYHAVREAARKARMDTFSPHDLRRTFITRLLDSGVDINSVRQLAGHASIQTTILYDRRDDKKQRAAMRVISSLL